eukprot:gene7094-5028_t
MSVDALHAKRERRQWEPEEKAWNDDALQLPWEEIRPCLHSTTIFSLKNVFFFSHATAIQAAALKNMSIPGNSAVIEAPTGSGKTLAFLLPLMERTIRMGEKIVADAGRPPLTRHILGVILSPSRALAEQTFIVGKRLAARFPFNIQFALCDGVIETAASALEHLKKCSRGVGSYVVTTPEDFMSFVQLLNEDPLDTPTHPLLDEQDEETRQRYLRKKGSCAETEKTDSRVMFYSSEDYPFLLIADEADMIFQYSEMRGVLSEFLARFMANTKSRKRTRNQGLRIDFFLIGATVSVSSELKDFVKNIGKNGNTKLHFLSVKGSKDFLSQLNNRFSVCASTEFLSLLVQLMNSHAGKKHFVFFNSSRTLLFVKQLFTRLTEGPRPILFVNNIFTMYEGMSESARIQQYNSFLTHSAATVRQKERPKPVSDNEKTNQFFTSGWKRSGTPQKGHGAVLLCTDVAAFGLDVRDVDYVYHFEPPLSVKTYVHRIGRVGRMGMKGTSILLLPCCLSIKENTTPRERKTTSNRFNTATNTKLSTAHLQKIEASLEDLPEEQKEYMKQLSMRISLSEHAFPAAAPISSTLRNIINEDPKILKLAKTAAMSMCKASDGKCWFSPRLALDFFFSNKYLTINKIDFDFSDEKKSWWTLGCFFFVVVLLLHHEICFLFFCSLRRFFIVLMLLGSVFFFKKN